MKLDTTIGFLGYGNMGAAILEGLLDAGALKPEQAAVCDPAEARQAAAKALGIRRADDPSALVRDCDTLVLAVKPQVMAEALDAIEPGSAAGKRVLSIAAGISIAFIQERLGPGARVIRVMPNTPSLASAGAAGIALGPNCTEEDGMVALQIFEAVGIAEMVSESDIDAVTALSGSGPAYFFYMTECLIKAAVAEGLSEEAATRLATQTMLGAGKLLSESEDTAAVLREKVTSKGGTTEAALKQFAADGFEKVIQAGVSAAAARSRELGA